MGYYHARPKDYGGATRGEWIKAYGEPVEFPDTTKDAALMRVFDALGYATATGMGLVPVTWAELASFAQMTGTDLSPWEAEALVKMSRAYVGEVTTSDSVFQRSPMEIERDMPE